jgi:hypothetical protein
MLICPRFDVLAKVCKKFTSNPPTIEEKGGKGKHLPSFLPYPRTPSWGSLNNEIWIRGWGQTRDKLMGITLSTETYTFHEKSSFTEIQFPRNTLFQESSFPEIQFHRNPVPQKYIFQESSFPEIQFPSAESGVGASRHAPIS